MRPHNLENVYNAEIDQTAYSNGTLNYLARMEKDAVIVAPRKLSVGHEGEKQVLHQVTSNGEEAEATVIAFDGLQRRLGNRQIQLLAIGGSIGTALFISIGGALYNGGPAGLLVAFAMQSVMVALINNCMAEMTTYMPVSGGFIRLAGHWVDDAFGFMAGWNFFVYEAITVAFEISALNLLLQFWRDDIPPLAVCLSVIAVYM